ncbi:MAG: 50S ribosomal protein L21 [Gammaproteobacteria bacterium]|nr:50S ribosomal protein L21 [Gammaproteobacteria bacterium]NNF61672.1 50S ribosomal protein L21 [Gammaproteobacteria bacterium]NNM20302.1 50S ribosomal protein L21 [Gammaproteobacteria bacterium]
MYAVIRTGGKQYRVTEGSSLKVEKIEGAEGDSVEFNDVLLVGNGADVTVGAPVVAGSKVTATVEEQGRSRKVDVVKFKRRKGYKRQHGHRQHFTKVRVTSITAG